MNVPFNSRFAQTLMVLFNRQVQEVRQSITPTSILKGEKVDLTHWPEAMVPILRPFMIKAYQQGMAEAVKALQSKLGNVTQADVRALRKRMLAEIDAAVFTFCMESVAKVEDDLNALIKQLRRKMKKGSLYPSEALEVLNQHLATKVASPQRANATADYHSHAGKQSGKLLIGGAAGVKGKKWICKFGPNCCEVCKSLHNRVVPIDDPFIVLSSGGPYATVMSPPLHPHCACESIPTNSVPKSKKKGWDVREIAKVEGEGWEKWSRGRMEFKGGNHAEVQGWKDRATFAEAKLKELGEVEVVEKAIQKKADRDEEFDGLTETVRRGRLAKAAKKETKRLEGENALLTKKERLWKDMVGRMGHHEG